MLNEALIVAALYDAKIKYALNVPLVAVQLELVHLDRHFPAEGLYL